MDDKKITKENLSKEESIKESVESYFKDFEEYLNLSFDFNNFEKIEENEEDQNSLEIQKKKYKRVFSSFTCFFPFFTYKFPRTKKVSLILLSDDFVLSSEIINEFYEKLFSVFSLVPWVTLTNGPILPNNKIIVPIAPEDAHNIELIEENIFLENIHFIDYLNKQTNKISTYYYFHSLTNINAIIENNYNFMVAATSWKEAFDIRNFMIAYKEYTPIVIYISKNKKIDSEYAEFLNQIDYKIISNNDKHLKSLLLNLLKSSFRLTNEIILDNLRSEKETDMTTQFHEKLQSKKEREKELLEKLIK
ncbi:MAG: hypothetical protein ACRC4M_04870 [Mycoplasma sp.]